MRALSVLGVVAALGFLAGCSSDIEQVRNVQATGASPFNQALAEEYKQFAIYEADSMFDWPDAGYFARKGLAAAGGAETPLPEELANWDIPVGMVDELTSARARLITVLDAGARDSNPVLAARAQGRFDCWVENAEENHQPMAIQACRDEFYTALEQLETPAPPAAAPAVPPEVYIVLFDFDKANIRPDGQQVVNQVLADAKAKGTPQISVTGHADRAGPADYNLALSLRRADAVRQALIAGGISADQITVSGRGEEEPAVPTPDGVREQANRRVEIIIQ